MSLNGEGLKLFINIRRNHQHFRKVCEQYADTFTGETPDQYVLSSQANRCLEANGEDTSFDPIITLMSASAATFRFHAVIDEG